MTLAVTELGGIVHDGHHPTPVLRREEIPFSRPTPPSCFYPADHPDHETQGTKELPTFLMEPHKEFQELTQASLNNADRSDLVAQLAAPLRKLRESLELQKQQLIQMGRDLDGVLAVTGTAIPTAYAPCPLPIAPVQVPPSPSNSVVTSKTTGVLRDERNLPKAALNTTAASKRSARKMPLSLVDEGAKVSSKTTTERPSWGEVHTGHSGDSHVFNVNDACGYSAVVGDLPHSGQENRRNIIMRLQARLGVKHLSSVVTAMRLHKTLSNLGSQIYSLEEISSMLSTMAANEAKTEGVNQDWGHSCTSGSGGIASHMVTFKTFAMVLLLEDTRLLHIFSDGMTMMIRTCRDILISGDTNRLVAELTQVHVDDLAQPDRPTHFSEWMEPITSLVILVNGVSIGWEVSQRHESNGGDASWDILDACFNLFFLLEMVMKLYWQGCRWFFQGPDRAWNIFDFCVVLGGIVDTLLSLAAATVTGTEMISMIRVIRLARLARLFRVLKLKQTRELTLMVKGVVVGLRTLFWAIVLLLFTVYILGVFATVSLGSMPPTLMDEDMFRNVPLAMLTIFRCLMGDCEDVNGRPLVHMYTATFGIPFVLCYVAAMIFVIFGVFNLIFAIYIETTLAAAKGTKSLDRKESVRVAKNTKLLLQKFAVAYQLYHEESPEFHDALADGNRQKLRDTMRHGTASAVDESKVVISKDLFLIVIQDPDVQKLLDALDISPDRASLFDVLDADGSGDLEASELVQGLLRVRGEARKSDIVANYLGIRACQAMIRKLDVMHEELAKNVDKALNLSHSAGASAGGAFRHQSSATSTMGGFEMGSDMSPTHGRLCSNGSLSAAK